MYTIRNLTPNQLSLTILKDGDNETLFLPANGETNVVEYTNEMLRMHFGAPQLLSISPEPELGPTGPVSAPDPGWGASGGTPLPTYVPIIADSPIALYVRLDGNDVNNGYTDTAGGAFRTLRRALREAGRFQSGIGATPVTINVGAGDFNTGVIPADFQVYSTLNVIINGASRATTIIHPLIIFSENNNISLNHLTIEDSVGNYCVYCLRGSLSCYDVRLKSTTGSTSYGVYSEGPNYVYLYHLELEGEFGWWYEGYFPGYAFVSGQVVLTNCSFTDYGLYIESGHTFEFYPAGVTGTATGSKYDIYYRTYLNTYGAAGANLPGDVAGSNDATSTVV